MDEFDIKIYSIVECVHCHCVFSVDLDDASEKCRSCGSGDFTTADML